MTTTCETISMNRSNLTAVKWAAILVPALLILSLVIFRWSGGIMPNYSTGQRTGTVYKVSYKGFVCKSWEGEMYVGNATPGQGLVGMKTFCFSTLDDEIAKKLEHAADTGKRTTVAYRQWLISPVTIETDYVITDVKIEGER